VALEKYSVSRLTAAFVLATGFAATFSPFLGTFENARVHAESAGEIRRVLRVIDGDTIVLIPNEKVRLIGVDTPETVNPKKSVECFGKAAREFTRAAVEGKNVRVELDDANAHRNHKDRYGRTLAYLFTEDGAMLNAELIRRGYAHAYTRFPFRYDVAFREMERRARAGNTGLWSSCRSQ
jgi:micrococcal nuclease